MTEVPRQTRHDVTRIARCVPPAALAGFGRTIRDYVSPPGISVKGEFVVNQSAPKEKERENPFGTVMLRMYDSENTAPFESLVAHYIGQGTLETLRGLVNADSLDTEQQDELVRTKKKINRKVYSVIKEGLGLRNQQEAHAKFNEMQRHANEAIEEHANHLYQGNATAAPNPEITLGLHPAELFAAFVDDNTDPVLRFELQRQFNNIVIALQIERNVPPNGSTKLAQIQNMLTNEFYAPANVAHTTREVFGLFDDRGSDIVGNPFYDPPTEHASKGYHYKRFILPVTALREAPGITADQQVWTVTNIKKRSTAINKALRKAKENDAKGKGDAIDVDTEVRDSHRMKLIVFGDQTQADAVRDRVFDLITNPDNFHYFYDRETIEAIAAQSANQDGVPSGGGDIKDTNGGHPGQSEELDLFRMLIEFVGVRTPTEIGFQTVKSYMRDAVTIGKFDRSKGKFLGPAHETYAIQREVPITDLVFPPHLYTQLHRPDDTDGRGPFPLLAAKAHELRHKYKYLGPFEVFQA